MLRDVPGQQFVDAVGLVIRNVREHEFQVGAWIDVVQFARADQAIHGGSSLTTAVGAREHKIAPTKGRHRLATTPSYGCIVDVVNRIEGS